MRPNPAVTKIEKKTQNIPLDPSPIEPENTIEP